MILSRGLHMRCPNCGAKSLFAPGAMRIRARCPVCDLELNRGEGFFLGPMVINYSIAVFGFVVPCILLWARGTLPGVWAAGLAVAACVALPIALYRYSWSLWLIVYFYVLPDRLKANSSTLGRDAGNEA
jgi:uncharacterized protein (DUF983 family)